MVYWNSKSRAGLIWPAEVLLIVLITIQGVDSLTAGHTGVCSRTRYHSARGATQYHLKLSYYCSSWLGIRFGCRSYYYSTSTAKYFTSSADNLYCCSGYKNVGGACHPLCSQSCVRGNCGTNGRCRCPAGWKGDDCGTDVDECTAPSSPCAGAHFCANTPGSYDCRCNSGYQLSGATCIDVNECTAGTHTCQSGRSFCTNTVGSYKCDCLPGYINDPASDKICIDNNECILFNGGCQHTCINTVGSSRCDCHEGFSLTGGAQRCQDIDECSEGLHNCTSTQNCRNTVGGFECDCKDGYEPDDIGFTCKDIDECSLGAGCGQVCINTPGSYQCSCRIGYSLDLDYHTCLDVNECSTNNGGCQHQCNNTEGSYRCSCNTYFFLNQDQHSCTEYTCGALEVPGNGGLNCSSAVSRVGTTCDYTCSPGYNLEGSRVRECTPSVSWSGQPSRCTPKQCTSKLANPPLFTSVFQPCSGDFDTSCPVKCSPGYGQVNSTSSVSSIRCELSRDRVTVGWTEDPVCVEGDPCSGNPCFHGTCTVTGPDDYTCDCQNTGYEGERCERGVLSLPSLPILTLGQEYQFDVEAHPDSDLTVSFGSATLQPSPSRIVLTKIKSSQQVRVRPNREGFHQMAVTLGGTEKDLYDIPKSILSVVKSSATSRYFDKRGLSKGILDPGCCPAAGVEFTCPASAHKVTFSSTSSWSGFHGTTATSGITFASSQGLDLPLSIAGSSFKKNPTGFVLRPVDVTVQMKCSACLPKIACGSYGDPGKCYSLVSSDADKVEFLSSEALAATFLANTQAILPGWLRFQATPTQRSYSEDSSSTTLWSREGLSSVKGCHNLPTSSLNAGVYSVMRYTGHLGMTVGGSVVNIQPSAKVPFCFVVNLCDGLSAAMHVSIPDHASDALKSVPIMKEFISRGWILTLEGISTRNIAFSSSTQDRMVIRGSLSSSYEVDQLSISLSFKGEAGLTVQNYDEILSNGLDQTTNVSLSGEIELSIQTSQGSYALTAQDGTASIGGWIATETCGNSLIMVTLNDNLYTRGENIFTSLLSIPPNYRYGDRYQFDCPITLNYLSNQTASLIGGTLSSNCHNLMFGRLEIVGVSHQIVFGQPARSQCLSFGQSDPEFPVVMFTDVKQLTQRLGHFLVLNKLLSSPGQIITRIRPSNSDYSTTVTGIKGMFLDTTFTADMTINSTALEIITLVKIFNLYDCNLVITSNLEMPWNEATFIVKGSIINRSEKDSFVSKLTQSVYAYLNKVTKQAISRRALLAKELKRSRESRVNLNTTLSELQPKYQDYTQQYQQAIQDIQFYSILVSELTMNQTQLGIQASLLSSRLDRICLLTECPDKCQPGLVTSDCSYQERSDVYSNSCPDQCARQRVENAFTGYRQFSCSYWDINSFQQNNCGCSFGTQCSCQLERVYRYCCCPSICRVSTYRQVQVTYYVPCTRRCVVRQQVRTIQRTCQSQSSCATLEPDQTCVSENSLCRTQRTQALNSLQDDSVRVRRKLEAANLNRMATNVKLISLGLKIDEIQKQIDGYTDNLNSLNTDMIAKELEEFDSENRLLLELGKNLDKDNLLFSILSVEFELRVIKESPKRFPLLVTVSVPAKNEETNTRVSFDFGSEPSSFYLSSSAIGENIVRTFTGQGSRGRRQANSYSVNTDGNDLLEEQCAAIGNLAAFFSSLRLSISSLISKEADDIAAARAVAAQLEAQMRQPLIDSGVNTSALMDFNVTLDSGDLEQMAKQDSQLVAILELKQSVLDRVRALANGSAVRNEFLIWKAEINQVLNSSGSAFGYSCHSLTDCFTVAINVLEGILLSSPTTMTTQLHLEENLEEAEDNLEEFSTSVNLTLPGAVSLLESMDSVLAIMIDLNYWCASPPNITTTSPSNVTVVEKGKLELLCGADSDFSVTYQWQKDDFDLPMQANSTLVIDQVDSEDRGLYKCSVTNHAGTASSSWMDVEVQQVPVFFYYPSDESRIVGDGREIALECNATSWPDPQFRWYFKSSANASFVLLANRTGSILDILSPQEKDAGWYRCEAWNSVASTYSKSARVTILRYTAAVTGFPLEVKLNGCDSSAIVADEAESIVTQAVSSLASGSVVSEVDSFIEDNDTFVSFLISDKNVTRSDLYPEPLQSIISRAIPSRTQLSTIKDQLKDVLADISTYTAEGLDVCSVADTSEDRLVYQCGNGQRLDTENNVLCVNCKPGYHKDSISVVDLDEGGRRFMVDYPTCSPCPSGQYQPLQGQDSCLVCPAGAGTVAGEESCEAACTYCCSKTAPFVRRILPLPGPRFLLIWSVPSAISSLVEGFEVSINRLSSRRQERHRLTLGPQVRAYITNNLMPSGVRFQFTVRMIMNGEICAPATIVRRG